MRPILSLALAALAALASGVVIPRQDEPFLQEYDAIIVGGGPAGLAALSGLARVRRNVLLVDSGEYRNAPTRHMHDVLGFDGNHSPSLGPLKPPKLTCHPLSGVTPAYFRYAAREQISHYTTVRMINGTVLKITPDANQPAKFTVHVGVNPDGGRGLTLTARKIILATGLRDVLPSTPGIAENWGKGIFWCPWCDGHEHADQELGLLGSLDNVPGAVREMLTLNTDIVAFVNGTSTPELRATTEAKSPGWEKYLRVHGVVVDNRTITGITRLQDGGGEEADPSLPSVAEFDRFRVDFTEGEPVERAAFLAAFPSEQTSKVGEEMGVNLYGGRLAADQSAGLVTNIPGVYAIGDANSDNVTNVPHALFSGKRTAVYLHGLSPLDLVLSTSGMVANSLPTVRLAREDGEEDIAGPDVTKRELEHAARSLWETVNGGPSDILYAGEFDQ